jgi:outer membrane protein TolC
MRVPVRRRSQVLSRGRIALGSAFPALGLAVLLTAGCSHGNLAGLEDLSDRVLLAPDVEIAERVRALPQPLPSPQNPDRDDPSVVKPADKDELPPPRKADEPAGAAEERPPQPAPALDSHDVPLPGTHCLTVPEAVGLAFRQQPRLRVFLETVEEARGRSEIAFAPFLPLLSGNYSAGGFDLKTGGAGAPLPNLPSPVSILPLTGSIPLGLEIQTGYTLADLHLQWLLCDFGRRLGRYRQAELAVAIAELQTERAYQTVANEVEVAFYQALRSLALRRIAQEAVRRAEEDLGETRKLAKEGAVEREKVLKAQAAVAIAQRVLDLAEAAQGTAGATLNLALGVNVASPACLMDPSTVPPFHASLADCLRTAVEHRREFQVARATIEAAQEGARVARADFAPRILADGALFDIQQASPRAHVDSPIGFIRLEWTLFEGGKRLGELRAGDARVRSAIAQADSIADTIAFQVNDAYRLLVTAQKGMDRVRPVVESAQESYRSVRLRFRQGDATLTEIIEAETALTRAEQEQRSAFYDYLVALARLDYAMGTSATPTHPTAHQTVVESK